MFVFAFVFVMTILDVCVFALVCLRMCVYVCVFARSSIQIFIFTELSASPLLSPLSPPPSHVPLSSSVLFYHRPADTNLRYPPKTVSALHASCLTHFACKSLLILEV
jgi:hypothetical protein